MKKVIVITGQTATGKTSLALKLAQKHNGELINCDSRQIYKYLDVITGKDFTGKFHLVNRQNNLEVGYYQNNLPAGRQGETVEQWNNGKLWLYDVVKPNEYFSSFDFVKLAIPVIKKILSEGKTPIIIGGTYLYLKHLLYGVESENIPPDWKLRKELDKKSVKELQNILTTLNLPLYQTLNNSELNNPQRLIRKIEITTYTKSHPELISGSGFKKNRFRNEFGMTPKIIGLKFKNKEDLRKTIEGRVEKRLKMGALAEVKKLLKMGYSETDPGLKTIGYQQLILHLSGVVELPEALTIWINKEVQYAKRQYIFMKKDKSITWRET